MKIRLTVALLFGLFAATGARSAETLAIGTYGGCPGGTVQVHVAIQPTAGVGGALLQINYDPTILRVVSATNTSGTVGDKYVMGYGDDGQSMRIVMACDSGACSQAGTLVDVFYEVNSGAVPGMYSPLVIAQRKLGGDTGNDLAHTCEITHTNGILWVTFSALADTDGDGLSDYEEQMINGSADYRPGKEDTDVSNPDTDGDGMPDGWEVAHGINPLSKDVPLGQMPVIANITNHSTRAGSLYSITPALTNGTLPVTWSFQGVIPVGMSINADSGVVTWTNPTPVGQMYPITIRATNSVAYCDEQWNLLVTVAGVVATPQLSPNQGVSLDGVDVTISCATPGAVIRYTTNNVDPTAGDTTIVSGGKLRVVGNVELRAKAWKSDWDDSEVGLGTYTILASSISILSPTNGAIVYTSKTAILAQASDSDGLREVRFYNGTNLIGMTNLSGGPLLWSNIFTWVDIPVGSNMLTAKTYDQLGNVITSTPVVLMRRSRVRNDFDGDKKSDLGVYYPNGGNWYVFGTTTGFYQDQFGYSGTVPVTGDFDGDGRTDLGVYYAPGGNWYIYATTMGFVQYQFGYAGTIPVTGDFDGDGKDDIGVYYPPGGNWYIFGSSKGFYQDMFGYAGTIPVVGDYDGDGRADMGVYYPPGGNWYIFGSSKGFYQDMFGYAGTIPVVGDYDGDGRADMGVYYPPGGNWYIFGSTKGFSRDMFGYAGTVPVVGDFDGDGRDDIGVFYAPTGMWYVFGSTSGFYEDQFGYSGTIPVGTTQIAP